MKTHFTSLIVVAVLFVQSLEAQLHLEISQGYSSIFSNGLLLNETYPTDNIVFEDNGKAYPLQFFAGFKANDYLSVGAVIGYCNMREEQVDNDGLERYNGSQSVKAWLYGIGLRLGKMHARRWYLGAGLSAGLMNLERTREMRVYDPNFRFFDQQSEAVSPYISLMVEERFYINDHWYLNLRPEFVRVESTYLSEASLTNTSGFSANPSSSQIITLSHFSLHFGIGIIL